jgi:hypothetical protein
MATSVRCRCLGRIGRKCEKACYLGRRFTLRRQPDSCPTPRGGISATGSRRVIDIDDAQPCCGPLGGVGCCSLQVFHARSNARSSAPGFDGGPMAAATSGVGVECIEGHTEGPKMSRSDARVEAGIRELCGLGLSGPQLAPLLFAELQAAVPFVNGLYMWLGPEGITDAYFNRPEIAATLGLYRERYFSDAEAPLWGTIDEAARTEHGPHHLDDFLRVSKAAYHRHPIYNEILRPIDSHTFVRTVVLDDGQPVGTFAIGRAARERDFDARDMQLLARLEPFVACALGRHDAPLHPDDQGADAGSGLVVLDACGRMCWMSAPMRELLAMACGSATVADAALPPGLQPARARRVRDRHRAAARRVAQHRRLSPPTDLQPAGYRFARPACRCAVERRRTDRAHTGRLAQPTARCTGLPTRLSISTNAAVVNLAAY